MTELLNNSIRRANIPMALALMLALVLASPSFASNQKKKKDAAPEKPVSVLDRIDTSKIVWPNPPNITRIRYLNYFAGEKSARLRRQTRQEQERLDGPPRRRQHAEG